MNSIKEWKLELKDADKANDKEKCIAICRQALPSTKRSDLEYFFSVRIRLVSLLVAESGEPVPPENIEEALRLLEELEKVLSSEKEPLKWAKVQSFLGLWYADRKIGDSRENLKKSIIHSENALQIITKQNDPENWANLKVFVAETCSNVEPSEESFLLKGINSLKEALQVYTQEKYPEDFDYVQKGIENLNERLNIRIQITKQINKPSN